MEMSKKKIFLWTLYDFANSITVVAFLLYFSQWLVVEHNVPDIWYNLMYTGSSILLIFTAPIAGIIADKKRIRMPYLRITTILMFATIAITSLLAMFTNPGSSFVLFAALAYMLGNYFYQLSFSFYNPLLNDIAPPEKQGLVSGLGQAANWLGAMAGIGISLVLLSGSFHLFGGSGRVQTFLPTAIIFIILALPFLLLFKDSNPAPEVKVSIKEEYKNFFKSFLHLIKFPGVGLFLLAFFFFNDAILTMQNNFPIFLEQVFGVSDKIKSMLLGGALVTSAIGAVISGWVADKVGLKKTLIAILILWALLFPSLGLVKNFPIFAAFAILMGFLYGATWTVTRAVMVTLSPKENLNEAFSYYTLSERFATFLGPLTWGLITTGFAHKGPVKYQIATLVLTVFIVIGLLMVRKLPGLKPTNEL